MLRWTVPPERREELMGPGAPFELREQPVLGTRHDVFVNRLPHLRALFDEGTRATPPGRTSCTRSGR